MRAVQLSNKIRYFACKDEQGDFGLLIYEGDRLRPRRIVEVNSDLDFKFWYSQFLTYENS